MKEIIQNKSFSEQFLHAVELESKVNSRVDIKVKEKMKNVKSANEKNVREMKELVPREIRAQITDAVANEIQKQLPVYLNSNYQMQEILRTHIEKVTRELDASVRNHVHKIVNEDQYHIVNDAFFKAANSRVDSAIAEANVSFVATANYQRDCIDGFKSEIKKDCDSTMDELRDGVKQLRDCKNRMSKMETTISKLQKQLSDAKTQNIVQLFLLGAVGIAVCAMKLHELS